MSDLNFLVWIFLLLSVGSFALGVWSGYHFRNREVNLLHNEIEKLRLHVAARTWNTPK